VTARRLTALAVVLALVAVVGLGVLVFRFSAKTEGDLGDRVHQLFTGPAPAAAVAEAAATDDAKERELVMSRANQFLLRINTYGPADLDEQNTLPGYAAGVRELMTAKLGVDFDKNLTLAEQTVSQSGFGRSAELTATGLESLEGDRASVLVAGSISTSYPDPEAEGRVEVEPRPFRIQVTLVRTEGQWLVDDFDPVGAEPAEQPTTPPAGQPTESAPGSPTPDGGRG
jgi:hypothetical protein